MANLIKQHDKKFLLIALVVILLTGSTALVLLNTDYTNENNSSGTIKQQDEEFEDEVLDEAVPLNDVAAPQISEVLEKYPKPDQYRERFREFMQYAGGKYTFQRYDEALSYYEAAIAEVKGRDDESLERAMYAVYLMAIEADDVALADRYEELIGSERLTEIQKEIEENESQR